MTRNGIATKVAARTAPEVWNGSVSPKVSSSHGPSSPRRPKARRRATPPTVGGSTIGRRTRERTKALPGKSDAGQQPGQRDTQDDREAQRPGGHDQGTA
ncbi:hypothetical protein GCM10020227_24190 [Streptomyces flavovirens]